MISYNFVYLIMNILFKQLISIRSVAIISFSCQIILKFLFFVVWLFSSVLIQPWVRSWTPLNVLLFLFSSCTLFS